MKKILFPILALVLAVGLAIPLAAPVAADSGAITVVSDDSGATVITKVYNKALGGNSVVDLSGSPLTAVRAWEPDPYPDAYPSEPQEATDSTWDNGVNWFEDNSSSADWIWETHLANDPASLDPGDSRYDADAAINGRVVLFETTFDIPGNPSSATLHIAADNGYEAWVNSGTHHLSSSVSGTGWESSNLHEADLQSQDWKGYGTFTIAGSELVTGSNTLYVLAGNEYFASDDVDYPNRQTPASKYNPGAVIFQLDIDYEVVPAEVPGIAIEKTGPDYAHVGEDITYTYLVSNTGNVPLSGVAVTDSLGITVSSVLDGHPYNIGDTNDDGVLDLDETWVFTASYEVPSGVDPVENIATASGISPLGTSVESDPADWSVDVLNPAISVVKSANTTAAAPGETVTYSYTVTNMGDCILYDVSLVDDVAGTITLTGLTDEDGDLVEDDLAVDATATGTAEYEVTFDDPEWLVNTATAEGTDELGLTVYDEDSCTIHTMGARTIGYWKTHPDAWCDFPSGSMFAGGNWTTLSQYFPRMGAEVDGVNPLEMLRAQLIAAELNYACFEDDFHYARYEAADIFGTMREAEAFLQRVYDAAGNEDLNAYWLTLTKKQQNNVKQIANPLKDVLDTFNNVDDEIFE